MSMVINLGIHVLRKVDSRSKHCGNDARSNVHFILILVTSVAKKVHKVS